VSEGDTDVVVGEDEVGYDPVTILFDAGLVSTYFACWSTSFVVRDIVEVVPSRTRPAQTSIHPLSDDFPRLIGRGPGDGRYRDRAEPAEMSVHPRGVGQSHPDPSLQHQASQVPTNGERFRATPNLVRQIVAAESRAQRSVFSVIRLDSRIR